MISVMSKPAASPLTSATTPLGTEWLDLGESAWRETVGFGPAGFPAYARLGLLAPPPPGRGALAQLSGDDGAEVRILDAAVSVLTAWTSTPDDAYFLLWDGMPWPESLPRPARPPLTSSARNYYILRGPLDSLAAGGEEQLDGITPAFIWPADRAWCLACDVDPDWAGIGAPAAAIQALLAAPGLEVTAAERSD